MPDQSQNAFPYVLALLLAIGSLLLYLTTAVVSRFTLSRAGKTLQSFNLGVPPVRSSEQLFAMSIASAATTLSTIFVLFLVAVNPNSIGLHLLFCPIAFAAGLMLMVRVYERTERNGYLDDSVYSGLIPALGHRLTNSRAVADLLVLLSALPMLALLALEIRYGILMLDFIVGGFGTASLPRTNAILDPSFLLFLVIVAGMLGYVFIGGFRAVVTSDVMQYQLMRLALFVALVSVAAFGWTHRSTLIHPSTKRAGLSFYVQVYPVMLVLNLLCPICLPTNWQRLRAFRDCPIDVRRATRLAIAKVVPLWVAVILIGFFLYRLPHAPVPINLTDQSAAAQFFDVLNRVMVQNDWFRFVVFPMLSLAAFSGMFSSADTCVSSLLYLTEWSRPSPANQSRELSPDALRRNLQWAMGMIFIAVIAVYPYIRWVGDRLDGLTDVTSGIFSTAVVLAPTITLLTWLRPAISDVERRRRRPYVMSSIALGFTVYWALEKLPLGQTVGLKPFALSVALVIAGLPAYLLLRAERAVEKEATHAGTTA